MYQPAFFEIFLLWLVMVLWHVWLSARGGPAWLGPVVRGATLLVTVAVGVGVAASLDLSFGEGAMLPMLPWARWSGVAVAAIGLAACGVGTLIWWQRPLESSEEPGGEAVESPPDDRGATPDAPADR